jgi:hypothetical protein
MCNSAGERVAVSEPQSQELGLLAKAVVAIGVLLIVVDIVWRDIASDELERLWHSLVDRPSASMAFRIVLQPLMATVVAILDGRKDARTGRSPYLWTILWNREDRIGRLREGLNATARIMLLAIAMDLVYQAVVLKTFFPSEAVIVALLLAFIPYLILRGPAARIARRWHGSAATHRTS